MKTEIPHRKLNMGMEVERKKTAKNRTWKLKIKIIGFCGIIHEDHTEQKSEPF